MVCQFLTGPVWFESNLRVTSCAAVSQSFIKARSDRTSILWCPAGIHQVLVLWDSAMQTILSVHLRCKTISATVYQFICKRGFRDDSSTSTGISFFYLKKHGLCFRLKIFNLCFKTLVVLFSGSLKILIKHHLLCTWLFILITKKNV